MVQYENFHSNVWLGSTRDMVCDMVHFKLNLSFYQSRPIVHMASSADSHLGDQASSSAPGNNFFHLCFTFNNFFHLCFTERIFSFYGKALVGWAGYTPADGP